MNARRAAWAWRGAWKGAWRGVNRRRVAIPTAIPTVILGLALLALAGCSLGGSGSGSTNTDQSLSALAWCDQPLISFQDDSQPSQQALTNWGAVKGQLGFTPQLPAALPKGSCLDLVGGSIHDPIFGAHLSITWVLPRSGPLSFSEAPKRNSVSTKPQCAQSQEQQGSSDATTICIGTVGDASITIASHMPAATLQDYFSNLQSNVDWQPTAPAPTATPVASATATTTGN
ncbi:MAG: hypothetical protein ACHQ1E_00640 [Ktedonobacterales bacterium]|jgi:hypothetical protein